MSRKVLTRLHEPLIHPYRNPMPWLVTVREDLDDFCTSLDKPLWSESKKKTRDIELRAEEKLRTIDIDLGGGGNFPLLYFLVRKFKPAIIVETGVAAGFSSNAILSAIKDNNFGHLYSSDLPYFRIDEPEKYIGFVVDENLKQDWTLLIEGDRKNLLNILSKVDKVDLFHYDSDKSYSGRKWAMSMILPRMRSGGIIIMDDLNDNQYFEDFVKENNVEAHVFEFSGKYVGLFYVV